MPTPVPAARQCLTDEASRALDDAVSVARRRNHAQTTSLHVVSAFLSLPSSILREACSRARSSAYAPRLQFRALELSVGVSLDRLPCSKNQNDDAPPISNSLMAAIKRSQANQRRQPEMYHLNQIQIQNGNPMSISSIKVELKQFVLSILDDPIVSRVFGEAGFRSCDIKLAIIHPPIAPPSRYSRARCPPLFLCNLTDNGFPVSRNIPFPFTAAVGGGGGGGGDANGEDYCKRIGEVLVKKSGRNPLLVGVCAKEALVSFKEYVERGKAGGDGELSLLPDEIIGLSFVCMEKEMKEFVANGHGDKVAQEAVDSKIKELSLMLENDSEGPGIVVSFGELKVLVDDNVSMIDSVKGLVFKLSSLVELHRKKLWLIGAAEDYETYSKFVERFPSIERDWDLHPLPITSSRSSVEGLYSKSSLMASFVPFGGFFSASSGFKSPLSIMSQPFTRCSMCNEKYEHEISATLNGGSSISIADQCSSSLPSWLVAESNLNKAGNVAEEAKDDIAASNVKILGIQKKWDDICQRLHHSSAISRPEISLTRPEVLHSPGIQVVADKQGSSSVGLCLNERVCSDVTSCSPGTTPKVSSHKQDRTIPVTSLAGNVNSQSKRASESSKSLPLELDSSALSSSRLCNLELPYASGSFVSSVTTDLGLGTFYAAKNQELRQRDSLGCRGTLQHLSDSVSVARSTGRKEKTLDQAVQSSPSTGRDMTEHLNLACYKPLLRELTERVGWQDEVVHNISQLISSCRSGYGCPRAPKSRGDIWITFLGPDKIGKRKIAEALADVVCGSKENLIAVDLSCQEMASNPNSMFHNLGLENSDEVCRKTVVGYIAEQLSKKPRSVVFLENVNEADLLVQSSLSHALRTGKFPDSHGREISITNTIFVTTSNMTKDEKNLACGKEFVRFSEQSILKAKNWQMQIVVECLKGDATRSSSSVVISSKEGALPGNKRKAFESSDPKEYSSAKRCNKMPKNCFDLNLPLEESEKALDTENSDSTSISDHSNAWLEDFLEQVDGKVVFKPFDFDALANQLMEKMSLEFDKKMRLTVQLEIVHEAMVEILAAAWTSYRKEVAEHWIERVLSASFAEAQQRYHLTEQSVVKLVSCEGLPVQEQAPGICLPSRVNIS
ncbi:hypothetical protein Ancab_011417 [Ancistrocladus abbreviatus]